MVHFCFSGLVRSPMRELKEFLRRCLAFESTMMVDFVSRGIVELTCGEEQVEDKIARMRQVLEYQHRQGVVLLCVFGAREGRKPANPIEFNLAATRFIERAKRHVVGWRIQVLRNISNNP